MKHTSSYIQEIVQELTMLYWFVQIENIMKTRKYVPKSFKPSIAINVNGQHLNITAVYSSPRHNMKYNQYKELFQQTITI